MLLSITNDKELAKVTLIPLPYFLTLGLSALVGGTGIVEGAIETTPHIPVTLRTDFMSSYHLSHIQFVTTKITNHQRSFSFPY
jgi:hypothetical protein